MQITDIEISSDGYCPKQARHLAHVCLTLADRIVTLFCAVELAEETGAEARRAAFLGDALRQMRRMPEFRAGRTRLEFADGLAAA
ncbi:hypothetical protein [Antarcticimicrobium luteum]|uniref:Uncharacterized protein n=1 Tax=Antarcticimicrobium luteum TaxID=2547397 RepID=A0A4V3ARE5_9RHOB|nr:hypothetical protein [Antarcticimicrobium luteum]TDK46297.1 hypothetical protein E1832_13025 [Antarcticimicrobium luteum]